jgi:cysteine-rich repeat protein
LSSVVFAGTDSHTTELSLDNTPPVISLVVLNSTNSLNVSVNDITAYVTYSDDNGDPVTFTYNWYKSGQPGPLLITTTNVLGNGNISTGDNWYVDVTPNDGIEDGVTVQSNNITILNYDPTATVISPDNNSYFGSGTDVNFSIEINDSTGIDNATLNIYNSSDDLVNQETTNLGGEYTLNTIVTSVVNLVDNVYTWFWNIFDSDGAEITTENRTLTIGELSSCVALSNPGNYTLVNDLSGLTDNCFVINSNGIVIDFNGHTISGTGVAGKWGVNINGYNQTTIKNGTITGFGSELSGGGAILLQNTILNNVQDMNLSNNGDLGIKMETASNNTISDIIAKNNGQSPLRIDSGSSYNVITNFDAESSTSSGYGIFLSGSSNNNIVRDSIFSGYSNNQGISLSSDNNLFDNLTLNNNNYGIQIGSATGNTFLNLNIIGNTIPIDDFIASSNTFIYNTTEGQIKWVKTDFDTDNNLSFPGNINIGNNFLEYVPGVSDNFNSAAELTLFNIPTSNLPKQILRDGSECTTCTLVSFANDDMVFNVVGFSNYTTVDICSELNETNTIYNLTNDITGITGNCFNITANNVTLDMGQFSITGGVGADKGIYVAGYNDSNIYNSNIYNFDQGIYLEANSNNNELINSNLYNNNQYQVYDASGLTYNNKIIYNNSFGQIEWTLDNITTNNSLTWPGNVSIGQDSAYYNPSVSDNLDTTADITLDLSATGILDPYILKDGLQCTDCEQISFASSILEFNVTGFSNYTVVEGSNNITSCMDINTSGVYALENDIVNDGSTICIEINADSVTIEGNGYTIDGIDGGSSFGILSQNQDYIIIRNLTVTDWATSIRLDYGTGITLSDVSESSSIIGIYLNGNDDTTLIDIEANSNTNGVILDQSQNTTTINGATINSNSNFGLILNSAYNTEMTNIESNSNSIEAIRFVSGADNYLEYDNSYGTIDFIPEINFSIIGDLGLNNNLVIGNNTAYLNSSSELSELNLSSNITLKGVDVSSYATPTIRKDGAVCLDCTEYTTVGADPTIFGVTSFSNYTIGEGPLCGDGYLDVPTDLVIFTESFESPDITGESSTDPTGWASPVVVHPNYLGLIDNDLGNTQTPYGTQFAKVYMGNYIQYPTNATTQESLFNDSLESGKSYNLSVNVAKITTQAGGYYLVDLAAIDRTTGAITTLASMSGVATNNVFSEVASLSYNSGASNPNEGDRLAIILKHDGPFAQQPRYDNVILTKTVVEECDDGNLINGDGCSATCTFEYAPNITAVSDENEQGVVDGVVHQDDNVTINATITTNTYTIDDVWVKIWDAAIDTSTAIYTGFLNFISGNLWSTTITTDSSFNPGNNNYTVYVNDTNNMTDSLSSEFFMDVQPIFSNYEDDSGTLFGRGNGTFNVTVTQTNGTVWLEVNGTNHTATKVPGSWSPAEITTVAWYDPSDSSTVINDSFGEISLVQDKSANNYNVVPMSVSREPYYVPDGINGLGVINSTADGLFNDSFSESFSELTVVWVGQAESTVFPGYWEIEGPSDFIQARTKSAPDQLQSKINIDGSGNIITQSHSITLGVPFLGSNVWNGSNNYIYKDGTVGTDVDSVSGTLDADTIYIGYAEAFQGPSLIGEVVVLRTSDNETRQKVEGYLAHKWNLTDNLPLDHPYKDEAPISSPTADGKYTTTHYFSEQGVYPYQWHAYGSDDVGFASSEFNNYTVNAPANITISTQYPTGDLNVTRYQLFNITTEVCCINDDCGDINVSLDPIPELWNATFDMAVEVTAEDVETDSDDNVYIAGTYGDNFDFTDMVLIKYDSDGNYIWNSTYDGPYRDYSWDVTVDSNNNPIVVGISWNDYITLKYDSDGNLLWNKSAERSPVSTDTANGVATDSNDNIIVTGISSSPYGAWTIKYDSDGNELWNVSYDVSGGEGISVDVDSNDNIIVVAETQEFGTKDWLFIKYNSSGSQLWNTTFEESGSYNYPQDIVVDSDDSFYAIGSSSDDNMLMKRDSNGNELWNITGLTAGSSININSYGHIIVTGIGTEYFEILDPPNPPILGFTNYHYTAGISSSGDILWEIEGPENFLSYGSALDSKDNVIVTGQFEPYGAENVLTIKYAAIAKAGMISEIPGAFPFYTIDSNPTTINLNVGECQNVTWQVNATGDTNTSHTFYEFADILGYPYAHTETTTYTVFIEYNDPNVELVSPVDDYISNVSSINFTANATDIDSDLVRAELNITPNSTGISSYYNTTISGGFAEFGILRTLADDIYTWSYRVFDYLGLIASSPARTLLVDTTDPIVTIVHPTNGTYYPTSSIDLNWTYTEINLDTCTYTIDGSNYNWDNDCYQETANAAHGSDGSCALDYSGSYTIVGSFYPLESYLYDGSWVSSTTSSSGISYLNINYTKPAGALDTSYWRVKTASNTYNIDLSPCWDAYSDKLRLRFSSDNVDLNNGALQCYDGSSWTDLIAPTSSSFFEDAMVWKIFEPGNETMGFGTDGYHNTSVTCVDTAGNTGTDFKEFYVDTTDPTISITTPLDNDILAFTVLLRAEVEDVTSGVASVTYEIHNGTLGSDVVFSGSMSNLGGNTYGAQIDTNETYPYNIADLNSTNLTFVITAVDNVGNNHTDSTYWILDNTKPSIQFVEPMLTGAYVNSNFTMEVFLSNHLINYTEYIISVVSNGTVYQTNNVTLSQSSYTWNDVVNVDALPEGNFSFYVYANDHAIEQNERNKSTWFIVDRINPVITIENPVNGSTYNDSAVHLNWTVIELNLDYCSYSLNDGADVYFSNTCTQETATESTACGGLATGSYSTFDLVKGSNTYDGDYGTRTIAIGEGVVGTMLVNYTKPANSISSSTWTVKDDSGTSELPLASCWNADDDKIILKAQSSFSPFNAYVSWSCDTTGNDNWVELGTTTVGPYIYEEAVNWEIATTDDITLTGLSHGWNNVSVSCTDLATNSDTSLTHEFYVDSPRVDLVSPENDTFMYIGSALFTCYVETGASSTLSNVTLYTNQTGTWAPYETQNLTGAGNYSFEQPYLGVGQYEWNCYACDDVSCAFDTQNWTTEVRAFPNAAGGGATYKNREVQYPDDEYWEYVVGDGLCQYSLGENRENSPDDCKPIVKDYTLCLYDSDHCIDDKMYKEAVILVVLVVLGGILTYMLFAPSNPIPKDKKSNKSFFVHLRGKK